MVAITRIITTVIAPPIRVADPPPVTLVIAAARRATQRCGPWPAIATIDGYLEAVRQARREVDWLETLEDRYSRRFGVEIDDNPPIATKWRSRHEVTLSLLSYATAVLICGAEVAVDVCREMPVSLLAASYEKLTSGPWFPETVIEACVSLLAPSYWYAIAPPWLSTSDVRLPAES